MQKFTSSQIPSYLWEKGAMNEPETKIWNEYLEQYRESARRVDGEHIHFVLHILPGKTHEIMRDIDEWIRRSQG